MSDLVVSLFPPIDPYAHGMLEACEGQAIYYEISGSPSGTPAVVLHGGPGQGCSPNIRRAFDPARYRVVLFDQRGCGRSTPHASDPSAEMASNTTHHLVADLERLRVHLGIERWLVDGASWGTTLALAYAQRHPTRVSALVLSALTLGRAVDRDWLYQGASRFFPEAFARFSDHVGGLKAAQEIVGAYRSRMEAPDRTVRLAAARAWSDWEDAVLSLEPGAAAASWLGLPEDEQIALVRICAHYVHHTAWLEEHELLANAGRLAGIPGVILHGRRDLSCPIEAAWTLARAWPGSELVALEGSGHLRSDEKRAALLAAHARFADRW